MFRGSTNPYDEIVVKATDENQTAENWEVILNLCDKVSDEGESGARNVIAAVLKRLAHRNANVQLYSLAVAEALSKNCGIEVHREIASRAFTQGLERLVTDRTGHDKVKKKATAMISSWAIEWENDPSLGIMNECYENLKSKGVKFEQQMEAPPPAVDDEIRRREEEELQRVLELSMQDKGGRAWGGGYTPSAGASSSKDNLPAPPPATSSSNKPSTQPTGGYAASSSRRAVDMVHDAPIPASSHPVEPSRDAASPEPTYTPAPHQTVAPVASVSSPPSASSYAPSTVATAVPVSTPATTATAVASPPVPDLATAKRVRALHNFEPADAGELAFEKGDVIKVVDRTHKDWWKGQIKGRTGIFPVNYVEAMPEPTPADLAREAEQEAAVFSQAANIDRLLTLLRNFDIKKDNLADNDEIQELYRSSLGVRPKIIRLIEKYNQKKVELAMMNDSFISAKELFDRMMEESVARHTSSAYDWRRQGPRPPQNGVAGYWGQQYPQGPGGFYPPGPGYADPAAAAAAAGYPPQIYPQVDPAAYAAQAQQQPQPAQYPAQDPAAYQQPQQQQPQQQQAYDPNAYAQYQQQQQAQGFDPSAYAKQAQQQPGQPVPTQHSAPGQNIQPYDPYAQQQPPQQSQQQPGYDANAYTQQQQQQQPSGAQGQQGYDPNAYAQQQQQPPPPPGVQGQQGYDPNAYAQQQQQAAPQDQQAYTQTQPTSQPLAGEQPVAANPAEQQQQQQQQQPASGQMYTQGPPYVYDPNGQYPDPNAQAWAQYYAAGGADPAGAVYFHSVPGVKEAVTSPPVSQVTQATPQDTPIEQQPQQQQLLQQQQPYQSPSTQPTGLSPKSPIDQLKQSSPRSKRISMAGVGTPSQHPELQSSLPAYTHELHANRPSSASGQSTGASAPVGTGQTGPWSQQQSGQVQPGRATSPSSGMMGPWSYQQGPPLDEPARAGSTSPSMVGGYRGAQGHIGPGVGVGQYGAVSPGGGFHPASAGPDIHSNQATPYPTFKPSTGR